MYRHPPSWRLYRPASYTTPGQDRDLPRIITLLHMAKDLTRSQKTNRAYTLALAGGGSGVAAVVLLFVSGFGLFLVFAVIAVLCFLGFRRTVS